MSSSPLELLLFLNSLGPCESLDITLEANIIRRQIEIFEKQWVYYNPRKPGFNRWGLSLTSLDGQMGGVPDLDSLKEYNQINKTEYCEADFKVPTKVLEVAPELRRALEPFAHLGRTHLLRLNKGGIFPPHRDTGILQPDSFRVFASLNYDPTYYSFVQSSREIYFEPGRLYLLNTSLPHSLVSFRDGSDFLVMNLPLNTENISCLLGLLSQQ